MIIHLTLTNESAQKVMDKLEIKEKQTYLSGSLTIKRKRISTNPIYL